MIQKIPERDSNVWNEQNDFSPIGYKITTQTKFPDFNRSPTALTNIFLALTTLEHVQ